MKNLRRFTVVIFWALIVVFLILIGQFFVPAIRDLFRGLKFLIPPAIFCLLGLLLLILTLKEKIEGRLKRFLILTGASALGFFCFVVLHNVFYALGTITKEIFILNYLIGGLGETFFLTAILVCPIGFLIGLIGSIVFLIKE